MNTLEHPATGSNAVHPPRVRGRFPHVQGYAGIPGTMGERWLDPADAQVRPGSDGDETTVAEDMVSFAEHFHRELVEARVEVAKLRADNLALSTALWLATSEDVERDNFIAGIKGQLRYALIDGDVRAGFTVDAEGEKKTSKTVIHVNVSDPASGFRDYGVGETWTKVALALSNKWERHKAGETVPA